MTILEKLRNMSAEELADYLYDRQDGCSGCIVSEGFCAANSHLDCDIVIRDYLESEL